MSSRRPKSDVLFTRAKSLIPGGVNSPARAFGAVGGTPVFIDRAEGAFLFDVDGNRYLDFIGSWGPHILGHRHPEVIEAIRRELEKGTSFGAPCELESELADMVIAAVPSVELVRMVSSGTEATMSAIRVARGFTRRDGIVKFAGCYHGHVDSLLVKAGSGALTHGVPSSPGIPAAFTDQTIVLEYNDSEGLKEAFQKNRGKIAAVIIEPVVGNMGVVVPSSGFLNTLTNVCREEGTLLIFDEVMTGFRLAYGGAQQLLGVKPDLTTFGKILGGGLPVGAYGGRREVMEQVSPVGPVYQAGTLSGNPLAMASGIATLQTLRDTNPYEQLDQTTKQLTAGLADLATKAGLTHTINQVGSMWTLFFGPGPIRNLRDASQSDTRKFAKFFHAMLDRGIYLACSQFEANFVSIRHREAEIAETLKSAEEALSIAAN